MMTVAVTFHRNRADFLSDGTVATKAATLSRCEASRSEDENHQESSDDVRKCSTWNIRDAAVLLNRSFWINSNFANRPTDQDEATLRFGDSHGGLPGPSASG